VRFTEVLWIVRPTTMAGLIRVPGRLWRALSVAALLSLVGVLDGAPVRIVSWNVREAFRPQDVTSRSQDFARASQALEPDVLLVQEVVSRSVVEASRTAMGLEGFHVACSDFVQSDAPNHNAFEVAIVSRFPFDQVIEFDPSPDNSEEDDPPEAALEPLTKIGIEEVGTSRGFLWAEIGELSLTVAVVNPAFEGQEPFKI
jgi:endonuclease/exonuclease/phosphatase family metal-dependent hydrolase